MPPTSVSFRRNFWILLPLLTMSLWLALQKGCEPALDRPPVPTAAVPEPWRAPLAHRLPERDGQPSTLVRHATGPSSEPNRPALKQAGTLLRQAADLLDTPDTNERLAVRLIREAIALLKQEGLSGIDSQDYDRVSSPGAFSPEHNRARPWRIEGQDQAPRRSYRTVPITHIAEGRVTTVSLATHSFRQQENTGRANPSPDTGTTEQMDRRLTSKERTSRCTTQRGLCP